MLWLATKLGTTGKQRESKYHAVEERREGWVHDDSPSVCGMMPEFGWRDPGDKRGRCTYCEQVLAKRSLTKQP